MLRLTGLGLPSGFNPSMAPKVDLRPNLVPLTPNFSLPLAAGSPANGGAGGGPAPAPAPSPGLEPGFFPQPTFLYPVSMPSAPPIVNEAPKEEDQGPPSWIIPVSAVALVIAGAIMLTNKR